MKVKYFQDTDTLNIEFSLGQITETRDLDENTLLELDERGRVCGLTIERRNLFAQLMQAVKYNSLGQISHALYEVGGEYRRNM